MTIRDGLRPGQLGVTLLVKDVRAAARFYSQVLGAREQHCHTLPAGPDQPGVVPIAMEMRIGDIPLTVCAENPHWREAPLPDWPRAPRTAGTTTVFLTLYVDDVDATMSRALAAGAVATDGEAPVQDTHWGDRAGQFIDPAGHAWRIQTAKEEVAHADLPGRLEALRSRRQSPTPRR